MIRGFEPPRPAEPETSGQMQLGPALAAGLIAGAILILIPRGSPWAALTFFAPVIMGRTLNPAQMPLPVVWAIQLAVAMVYALILAWFTARVTSLGAFLVGAVVGLGLYLVNLGVVSLCLPTWGGHEMPVLFTHVVFGLIAAGAYQGLLRRRVVA